MIERVEVRNFKSLGEISLPLGKFNCLIGMNGAGKSTVLQVLDFISQVMIGQVQEWLDARGWKSHDLNCKLRKENNVTLKVSYRTGTGQSLIWRAAFNRTTLRCSGETITLEGEKILHSTGQDFRINGKPKQDIAFVYQGSLLSTLKESELPEALTSSPTSRQNFVLSAPDKRERKGIPTAVS